MQNSIDEFLFLTGITARELLREKGYAMNCRFGHIHAMQGNREWHLCMQDALVTMNTTQFLACLNVALRNSQRIDGPLLPLVETFGGRA